MKRLLAAALLLCAACSGPQVAFNPKFKDVKYRRVALAGFEGPAGEAASDILAHELLGSGADVVERGRLQSVLNEQRLGASGALDPASVRKVGRLLGVDALMLGSVTQYAQPQSFLVTGTSSAAFVGQPASSLGQGSVYTSAPALGTPGANILTSAAVVGMTARLVDVETGSVVWSGRRTWEGFDVDSAMASIAHSFAKSLTPLWR
ncbi:MAG TPA: hypothetical protein DCM05_14845 [Elusimicrobia bacterium]|nr:hypothetical protein [Elusimicrobiota bacterium]